MTPDPAEPAAREPPELLLAGAAGAMVGPRASPSPGTVARLRDDPARLTAIRDCWRALWASRVLVWVAGIAGVLGLGLRPAFSAFDPPGTTAGFGWLADRLLAPTARWDSSWFLVIAQHGYSPEAGLTTSARAAFFPLYPLAVGAIGELGIPLVLAGVTVSLVAFALALYGLHRLTTLELEHACTRWSRATPQASARMVVLVTAFFPTAFFLSAVYSESLYLALSVGVFWCARSGRWGSACALGAFAAATRSAGIVLALPIAILYLYGPRADRGPDRGLVQRARPILGRLTPRYRLRRDALWLALVPAGLVVFMGYLALSGGRALTPFHAQAVWDRTFAGPFVGAWHGAAAGFDGLRQLISMQRRHVYFTSGTGNPLISAQHNVVLFAFLIAAAPALLGVLRRLPFAYGAYALAALALPLSYPVSSQPLMSLPRFLVVLFPLHMWFGARLAAWPRAQRPVLGAFAVMMAALVIQFATWHWVA